MANTIFTPQLVEAGVQARLGDAIKLYAISKVVDINGKQGGEMITVVRNTYSGDATAVAKGVAIPVSDFTHTSANVPVVKYGKAMSYAQEDMLNAYFDVNADAEAQIVKAVSNAIDKAQFTKLSAITGAMLHTEATKTALDKDVVSSALVKFGEDLDEEKYLLVNPAEADNLRKNASFISTADSKLKAIGEIFDCKVVISNRVPASQAFIVKEGALSIYLNQGVTIEEGKDILKQTYNVVGTALAGVDLFNEAGAIKIALKTGA